MNDVWGRRMEAKRAQTGEMRRVGILMSVCGMVMVGVLRDVV